MSEVLESATVQIDSIQDYLRLMDGMQSEFQSAGTVSYPGFLLKYGRSYNMTERSFEGRRGKPKCCFMNAYRLAMEDPSLVYVEGYCDIGIVPIAHAWCVDADGNVIDPTLRDPQDPSRNNSGVYPRAYFGVPFKTDYVVQMALKTGYYGIFGGGWIGKDARRLLTGNDSPDSFLYV